MQIFRTSALVPAPSQGAAGPAAPSVLQEATNASNLGAQIVAYQDVSSRWRTASDAERTALTPALTDSAFARRAQVALNSFTRAAWAGADAISSVQRAHMLKAFDSLSQIDQEIVAGLHVDPGGKPLFTSAADFRERLVTDLKTLALEGEAQSGDRVTWSEEALARLADGASEAWAPMQPTPASPADADLARAIAAYARA